MHFGIRCYGRIFKLGFGRMNGLGLRSAIFGNLSLRFGFRLRDLTLFQLNMIALFEIGFVALNRAKLMRHECQARWPLASDVDQNL